MKWINSYKQLGTGFYQPSLPTSVADPKIFLWNPELANQLNLPQDFTRDSEQLAAVFSGNQILPGMDPISLAYAGHQFGHFVPQLGDGRAHLLGEILDAQNKSWDIQLKGSGRTEYSRNGDGRCALGPAIREFIMSNALRKLGVPTTDCLAVTTTGESVFRETALPGAVVTRVASSHLRVGTFQYFAAQKNHKAIQQLCQYTFQRHFPELDNKPSPEQYILLLDKIIERQIRLVTEWMRVGFIHGVMNTDNTSISGDTLDFGPCAMMEIYHPQQVFSSIDRQGRYAFGNQPQITQWNMSRFADCLIPLIDSDFKKAIDQVAPLITEFPDRFKESWIAMMQEKIGLIGKDKQSIDQDLIPSLLQILENQKLDYTIFFQQLTISLTDEKTSKDLEKKLGGWYVNWQKNIKSQEINLSEIQKHMQSKNPIIIPRNHHMEKVIESCILSGSSDSARAFIAALNQPYNYDSNQTIKKFQEPASDGDQYYKTFCGT